MGMVKVLPGLGDRVDGVTSTLGYGGSGEPVEGIGFWDQGATFSQPNPPLLPRAGGWDLCRSQTQERMERHLILLRVDLRGTVGRDTEVRRSEGHRRCHDAAWALHVPWDI